ncbi:plasmid mobilization relaxosome protein MobC [Billgrantia bachuensis]|uniref:MobC family plasmid mobilization relaxosome protein n=1 Tax=Billgrantia bachuensis TaxID=2717286 RepID=A0ABX0PSI7_9GAMM|nr:plasmid mobilization relaxosome protein MobC [Halomonas bachuensis]NIC06305.1 MobC family plasmid mobilization relaxosome protein [Halomonas bachuensis]
MPRVEARLTEIEKNAWAQFCKANGLRESDMLRRMIHRVAGRAATVMADDQENEPRPRKLTIRLSPSQERWLAQRAQEEGYPSRTSWVTAMVLAELHREPVLTEAEVAVLRESNRELRAIGKNLNQITKALNIEFRESDKLKREAIEALAERIEQHKDQVASLLSRNMNRWRDDG